MSARTQILEHRQQLLQLRSLADEDLRSLLAVAGGGTVADSRNLLIDALPELLSPYMEASGQLAAVLFEDLRAEVARRGVFYAETAGTVPSAGWVDGTVRWAVTPLTDDALASTVLTRVSGAAARMIMDASRETMYANGQRESIGFQRMARSNACAFCGMLASRPPEMLYKSEASAGGVVGRGKDVSTNFDSAGKQIRFGNRMAKGVKARGARAIGSSTHDNCRCVVMPIYPGTEMARLAEVEQQAWMKKYVASVPRSRWSQMTRDEQLAAYDQLGSAAIDGVQAKTVLANWRKIHGTH